MQLSEILEEHSVKAISQKTNISEDNIEVLIAENFKLLTKAKALGFISIIEREYHADLTSISEKALTYYDMQGNQDNSLAMGLPQLEEKQGRSKWLILLVLGLLAYASWYFFTNYDKKMVQGLIPFNEKKIEIDTLSQTNTALEKEEMIEKELSIGNALSLTRSNETQEYNNAKEHYFKVNKEWIETLSKEEYVS